MTGKQVTLSVLVPYSTDRALRPACHGMLRVFGSAHISSLVSAGFEDVAHTVIFTERPMHVRKAPYVANW